VNELTTFADRVVELQQLFQRLATARQGAPQLVLVEGAVGSGKSELLRELARRLAERGPVVGVVSVAATEEGAYDPVALAAGKVTLHQLYDQFGGRRKRWSRRGSYCRFGWVRFRWSAS
jgi:signal recognition particle GTPase